MTLFSIVKIVMESNGWPAPVTEVSSSSDPNMKQAMALAQKTLDQVSYSRMWPVLLESYTFTTVANQADYPLPTDFHHIISNACFNATGHAKLRGSVSPADWNAIRLGMSPVPSAYRIFPKGKMFSLVPTPQGAQDVTYEYVTKNLAYDAAGTPKTNFSVDSDYPRLDEAIIELNLTWRWRQKKGLDYTAELAEATGITDQRFAQMLALGESPIGGGGGGPPLTDGYIGPQFNYPYGA